MKIARRPRYYVPRDAEKPGHLPGSMPIIELYMGQGPDAQPEDEATGGGRVYGGPYIPGEPGWKPTPQGWWVNVDGVLPQACRRLVTVAGPVIEGVQPDHKWQIPHLLNFYEDGSCESALDPVLGYDGWDVPEAYKGITERLRTAIDRSCDVQTEEHVKAYTAIAIELLAVNHYVCEAELITGGWLSYGLVSKILKAAGTGSPHVNG